jgi:hypothetical protein
MSNQVTAWMVNAYSANVHVLGQQMASRLQALCRVESGIVGQSKSVERIGASEAYDLVSRHADTQYVNTPHSRRWIDLGDKAWADLVDELDKIKMLADPTSPYVRMAVAAHNRKKDALIYAASRGTARTGSGTQALPSAQKIAASSSGMTVAKLLAAKEILDANEVDAEDTGMSADGQGVPMRTVITNTAGITDLLATTEVKSSDYNTVKALAQGKMNDFLGFRFVRYERLATSSTTKYAVAFGRNSVCLGIGKDIVTSIDTLPGKNMSVQVYSRQSLGAVRVEDEGVVEIAFI